MSARNKIEGKKGLSTVTQKNANPGYVLRVLGNPGS